MGRSPSQPSGCACPYLPRPWRPLPPPPQTFVERLVRLPGCFLCYTPPPDAPPVAPPPAAARGFITFGSFNALAKVTDAVLALWARVLVAVPGSRLVLKNKPFACAQTRALWAARLAAAGVDALRVDLLPLAASNAEHLGQYALLDVSLDPFPYAGERRLRTAGCGGAQHALRAALLPRTPCGAVGAGAARPATWCAPLAVCLCDTPRHDHHGRVAVHGRALHLAAWRLPRAQCGREPAHRRRPGRLGGGQ